MTRLIIVGPTAPPTDSSQALQPNVGRIKVLLHGRTFILIKAAFMIVSLILTQNCLFVKQFH